MTIPLQHANLATGVPDFGAPVNAVAKTADYTIVPKDNGTRFSNSGAVGAVIFTLPALGAFGYIFEFIVLADQSLTVTSAEGNNIIAPNTLVGDSVAFSTSSDKIGGFLRISSSGGGTKWLLEKPCSNALSITY